MNWESCSCRTHTPNQEAWRKTPRCCYPGGRSSIRILNASKSGQYIFLDRGRWSARIKKCERRRKLIRFGFAIKADNFAFTISISTLCRSCLRRCLWSVWLNNLFRSNCSHFVLNRSHSLHVCHPLCATNIFNLYRFCFCFCFVGIQFGCESTQLEQKKLTKDDYRWRLASWVFCVSSITFRFHAGQRWFWRIQCKRTSSC